MYFFIPFFAFIIKKLNSAFTGVDRACGSLLRLSHRSYRSVSYSRRALHGYSLHDFRAQWKRRKREFGANKNRRKSTCFAVVDCICHVTDGSLHRVLLLLQIRVNWQHARAQVVHGKFSSQHNAKYTNIYYRLRILRDSELSCCLFF